MTKESKKLMKMFKKAGFLPISHKKHIKVSNGIKTIIVSQNIRNAAVIFAKEVG